MKAFLVVGDYNRQDFIAPFYNLPSTIKLYFIEHLDSTYVKKADFPANTEVIFWKDYSDAYQLLNQLRIEKIFFFFIEAYNHVALRAAADELGIKTVHVEHGLRFNVPAPRIAVINKKNSLPEVGLKNRLRNFTFYLNTILKSKRENLVQLIKFYLIRRQGIDKIYHPAVRKVITPDIFISFSSEVFKHHVNKLNLSTFDVIYTGIPQFDHLVTLVCNEKLNPNIVFIDQPFVEQGILGWTDEHRGRLLGEIIRICKKQGRKFLCKIHPASSADFWGTFAKANSDTVEILDDNSFKEAIVNNYLILGFCSTLHLPLVSLPHTVLLCLEIHPIDVIVQPSSILTEAGVATSITSFNEIEKFLVLAEEEHKKQKAFKAEFTKKYLYKADGHSSERFVEAILS